MEFGEGRKSAIGGFSAGGTLALGVAQLMVRKGLDLESVVAFYPPLDFSEDSKSTLPEKNPWKRDPFHEAYLLEVANDGLRDPLLSPKYAAASELPNSVVMIIPEIDPNRIDMHEFVECLKVEKGDGVVEMICDKCFHGWNLLAEWIIGKERAQKKWEAYDLVVNTMKKVMS